MVSAFSCSPVYSNTVAITIKNLPVVLMDTAEGIRNVDLISVRSVLSNDFSPDGDELMVNLEPGYQTSAGGTVTIDDDGNYVYKPLPGFLGTDSVKYNICVRNTQGLVCSEGKLVFIIKEGALSLYPTISPNDDNINDEWVIENIDRYPNNQVTIYDRWGNKIYHDKGYNNTNKVWKGHTNVSSVIGSRELPEGTYFYLVELGDGSKVRSGYIVLKR
jgi:gliding motility-associated-like protein